MITIYSKLIIMNECTNNKWRGGKTWFLLQNHLEFFSILILGHQRSQDNIILSLR